MACLVCVIDLWYYDEEGCETVLTISCYLVLVSDKSPVTLSSTVLSKTPFYRTRPEIPVKPVKQRRIPSNKQCKSLETTENIQTEMFFSAHWKESRDIVFVFNLASITKGIWNFGLWKARITFWLFNMFLAMFGHCSKLTYNAGIKYYTPHANNLLRVRY